MSVTDYVIDILLILVIFRAVRPHRLTPRAALLPLVLLAVAGIVYLRPVTLGGNDLALILILAAVGIVLGMLSGLADRIWRDERQRLVSRAVAWSVIVWVIGMGFRFGFAYYAYHGGGPAVARFSVRHDLSGADIWTTALVLMAFGQVLARLAVLQIRRVRHDRLVLLCSHRSQSVKQSSYIDLLATGAIDGMLYLGSFRSNERLAVAIADGLPVVIVDEPIAGLPPVPTVVMDDYAGGYQATSYLVALGHRRIAFVSGPAELGSVQERLRGYRDALAKGGIDADRQVSLSGQFTEQFGMSALPHLLPAPEPPTAAFVASDYIALGVLSAAEAHGIGVPGDLSIVGFDDIRFAQYVRPRLTTIRSPVDRLAQTGVELLFERLADPLAPARTQVLPVKLVIRESAAAPAMAH